jgi:hypothetical protein
LAIDDRERLFSAVGGRFERCRDPAAKPAWAGETADRHEAPDLGARGGAEQVRGVALFQRLQIDRLTAVHRKIVFGRIGTRNIASRTALGC